jgi:hypothetical protein
VEEGDVYHKSNKRNEKKLGELFAVTFSRIFISPAVIPVIIIEDGENKGGNAGNSRDKPRDLDKKNKDDKINGGSGGSNNGVAKKRVF